jgi:hypothetical protein
MVTGCTVLGGMNGFTLKASTGLTTDADRWCLSGCIARSGSGIGFSIESDNCSILNCQARAMDTGFETAASANQTIFVGNMSLLNVTANFTDGGTNTVNANNIGFV